MPLTVAASCSSCRGSPTASGLWLGSAPGCVGLGPGLLSEGLNGPLVGAAAMLAQVAAHVTR